MSVKEALAELDEDVTIGTMGVDYENAKRRLILEVQAEMPCYRMPFATREMIMPPTDEDWLRYQPCFRAPEGAPLPADDYRCPSCTARGKLGTAKLQTSA